MSFKSNNQIGQTLIETMVASLVLVLGIGASVGLAVFAFHATSTTSDQLVAIGLAREGIEAVKNMRDTNWLRTNVSTTCYNFYDSSVNDGVCYPNWLTGGGTNTYNLSPMGGSETYFLQYDVNSPQQHWNLIPSNDKFGLYRDGGVDNNGFYYTTTSGVSVNDPNPNVTEFARMVTLSTDNFAPFDQTTGVRLKVTVDVWWQSDRCPESNLVPNSTKCKVTLATYLTNWKNYQVSP